MQRRSMRASAAWKGAWCVSDGGKVSGVSLMQSGRLGGLWYKFGVVLVCIGHRKHVIYLKLGAAAARQSTSRRFAVSVAQNVMQLMIRVVKMRSGVVEKGAFLTREQHGRVMNGRFGRKEQL